MRSVVDVLVCSAIGAAIVVCALFVRLSFVGGRSMEPALVPGDLCLACARVDIAVGDIVLYRRPGSGPVLHRVVGIGPGGELHTRGDANASNDREPVSAGEIRGRVLVVLPLGRAARGWMSAVRGATLLTQSR